MSAFSQQQIETLERAYAMLGEHFDGVLLAVMTEVEGADQAVEASKIYHYGGRLLALGLCKEAEYQLLRIQPRNPTDKVS